MMWGFWLALVLYLLGVAMYLTILESIDEEAEPNAVLFTSFIWPWVSFCIILDRIKHGTDKD